MANSSCIREWKNLILSDLMSSDDFMEALDVTNEEQQKGLVYSRLFPYEFVPQTSSEVTTYVWVEVSIKQISSNKIYSYPTITITMVSHQDHMKLSFSGLSASRNDYLAELVDNMFNGATKFGTTKLVLIKNAPYSINSTYRCREVVFKGEDINDGLCDE